MYHYTSNYLMNPYHPIKVALIGAGGSGSYMAQALAKIDYALRHTGHQGLDVTIFDGDEVSESNIGRQLFSPSDISQNKAVITATKINRFYGTIWRAIPWNFNDRNFNIFISCVDSAKARIEISQIIKDGVNGYSHERKFYWLDLGNSLNSGQFVLGTVNDIEQPKSEYASKLPTVLDLFPDIESHDTDDNAPSCSLAQALNKQDLFINSTLVQFASSLLWKLFKEARIEYHGMFLNLENMKSVPIPIK